MSIYSDYKVGAMDDIEFHNACARENRRDRYEREREYIDAWEQYAEEDLVIDDDDYPYGYNPWQE